MKIYKIKNKNTPNIFVLSVESARDNPHNVECTETNIKSFLIRARDNPHNVEWKYGD
jgi:hypothetical protein